MIARAADVNARATWSQRRNGLRAEPAAKWAMQLAVLAALGAMSPWALITVAGDPRRSLHFWGLALIFGVWGAPVQAYSRWTMLSLWFFALLWPVVALAGVVVNQTLGDAGVSAALMAGVLAYTVAMSAAALVALRRSSLPFGTAAGGLYPAGYRAPGALPEVDAALRSIQMWFAFPLIATVMVMSAVLAGYIVMENGAGIGTGLAPMLLLCLAEPLLLAWGQYQGRRRPGLAPPAFVALAVLQSAVGIGATVFFFVLSARTGSGGAATGGMALGVVAAAVIACDVAAWRRMRDRAASHRT